MMRRFELHRIEDVTGVSGTGVVAQGVEFDDGVCALRWLTEWPTSVVFHDRGAEAVEHVHGHNGRTEVVWLDSTAVLAREQVWAAVHAVADANTATNWAAEKWANELTDALMALLRAAAGSPPPTPAPTWEAVHEALYQAYVTGTVKPSSLTVGDVRHLADAVMALLPEPAPSLWAGVTEESPDPGSVVFCRLDRPPGTAVEVREVSGG